MKDHHFCIKVLQKERVYNSQKEQEKPSLHHMNRCNSLKYMQHFDAHNSNKKRKKHYKTF